MKQYLNYKDSGIKWIGEIPERWQIVPLTKYLDSVVDYRGRTPLKVTDGIFLVTAKNIKHGTIDYSLSEEYVDPHDVQSLLNRGRPKLGDVLFTTEAPLGEVANIDREDIALAQRVIKFRGKQNILDNYFLKFWLLSEKFQQDLQSYSTGSTALGIKASKLNSLKLVFPPFQEQKKITKYLDHKITKIDTLIEKKKQQIELLKEERTAVINQAVTKGLDPNVPMKDLEIEWLGDIPQHWDVKKLRFLGELQNGISKSSDSFGSGYPFLGYGSIYDNEITPKKAEGLVNSTELEREKYSVKEGDVFFTRTSETIEETGIPCTCMVTIENCVFSGFVIRFRNTSKVLTKGFSRYYFQSHYPRVFLVNEMNIVTRSSLSQDLLKRLPILLPPLDEQQEIAEYLDNQTKKVQSFIEKANKIIDLLQDYRTALISEVVTGKIDVREEMI